MEIVAKVIIIFTIVQRVVELFIAKSNEKFLLGEGAKIIPEKNYLFMVALHTSWLSYLLWFVFNNRLNVSPKIFIAGMFFFLCGQALRITAIKTLGKRWSTRIVILPKAPAVRKGVFQYFRHPNYLGVVLEIFALPLLVGAYKAMIFFTLANAIILYFRIKKEEHCLKEHNDYAGIFGLNGN